MEYPPSLSLSLSLSLSVFHNNSGANGIVSVGYTPMNFTGRNIFSYNSGTALRVSKNILAEG